MANVKISQLPSATTPLSGTELLEIVQSGTNKKVAASDIGAGGGIQSITGDIVDNTDPLNPVIIDSELARNKTFYGEIYNKSTWTNLSDFTNNGSTSSVVSNKINFSGGANTYTQSLDLNGYTNLEHWKATAKIKVTGTGNGFGIGIRSAAVNIPTNLLGKVNTSTGESSIVGGTSSVPLGLANSASNLTINTNDEILIQIQLDANIVTLIVRNLTTGASEISTIYTYDLTTTDMQNNGRFSIFSFGGTFTVESFQVTSNEIVGADVLCIGDSKTKGYGTTYYQRWASLLQNNFETVVSASGNETTQDIVNRLAEIVALAPKNVLLAIGSNDIRTSVSSGTWQANYNNITTTLEAAGIRVIHLLAFYESSANVTPLVTYVNSTYLAANIIDTNTPMTLSGMLSADNIHPSTIGNSEAIYSTIIQSYKLTPVRQQYYNTFGGYIQNQNVRYQDAAFKLNGASDILNNFVIGTGIATSSVGTVPFKIRTQTSSNLWFYGNAGRNYIASANNGLTGAGDLLPFDIFASEGIIKASDGATIVDALTWDTLGNFTFAANVIVGTGVATASLATIPLRVKTQSNSNIWMYGNAGNNYLYSAKSGLVGASDKLPFEIHASTFSFILGDTSDINAANFNTSGRLFVGGNTSASALLHLGAGTATASTAPLKFTAGTLLTTPELGAMELVDNGTTGHLYITLNVGGVLTRVQIV